jgi:hypothetical protein
VLAAPAAMACGYEDPSDVAVGLLNWTYPKALYVRTAVWQAENAGILPPRAASTPTGLFGSGFRQAAASMNELGRLIGTAAAVGEGTSFSVVLIPAVMWTRFSPTDEGYAVQVHADGPAKGDVVIVTDEKVVRALIEGSLDAVNAEAHGLLRLYREPDLHDKIRSVLMSASMARRPASETPGAAARRDGEQ